MLNIDVKLILQKRNELFLNKRLENALEEVNIFFNNPDNWLQETLQVEVPVPYNISEAFVKEVLKAGLVVKKGSTDDCLLIVLPDTSVEVITETPPTVATETILEVVPTIIEDNKEEVVVEKVVSKPPVGLEGYFDSSSIDPAFITKGNPF